jgi:hypothetical protein
MLSEAAGGACEICADPRRELIEYEVWGQLRGNDDVARRFGLGGGVGPGAELLRQHRLGCVSQAEVDLLRGREDGFRHREAIVEELRARRAGRPA